VARLLESAIALLGEGKAAPARGEVEALLREIDANFDARNMPADLAERRAQLLGTMSWA
jgi:MoxR-like ATPase